MFPFSLQKIYDISVARFNYHDILQSSGILPTAETRALNFEYLL